jgi:hypothetical protein
VGREEPCDFHSIINEWKGQWVVAEPGEGLPLPGFNDLRVREGAGMSLPGSLDL